MTGCPYCRRLLGRLQDCPTAVCVTADNDRDRRHEHAED